MAVTEWSPLVDTSENEQQYLVKGPGGFRADAFVKPIDRPYESRSTAIKKLK